MSQIGLTYAEIAARLRVTKRTVANYMAAALEHCYPGAMSTADVLANGDQPPRDEHSAP